MKELLSNVGSGGGAPAAAAPAAGGAAAGGAAGEAPKEEKEEEKEESDDDMVHSFFPNLAFLPTDSLFFFLSLGLRSLRLKCHFYLSSTHSSLRCTCYIVSFKKTLKSGTTSRTLRKFTTGGFPTIR